MLDFIKENATAIYWFVGVISISGLLLVLINKGFRILIKKGKEKGYDDFSAFKTIQKILKVFIIIFLVLFLSFYLVDEKYYEFLKSNIRTIAYLAFVGIFTVTTATLSNTIFNRLIKKKNEENGNPTSYKFLKYVSTFLIYALGIALVTFAFESLKGITQTAVGGAGILAVIIGVASQEALANLIGGFFIILFKPFNLHDVIKVSDEMVGEVTDITLRHTVIRNYQNKMIVIPNSIINKEKVINYNLGEKKCCQWIEFGISYDSDIDLAKKIINEECQLHPNLMDNRTPIQIANGDPKVLVRVIGLNDSDVKIRAWAWAADFPAAFVMKCEVLEAVKKRFDIEGIEIPFPHRTLVFKNQPIIN